MYCDVNDILAQIDRQKLIEISNDDLSPVTDANGDPDVNTGNVEKAIADAGAEIDSYASVRYKVPFNPAPALIKKLAADIAIYNLFSRKWTGEEENIIVTRYKDAVKLLDKISQGAVQIGVTESKVLYQAPAKVFGDSFRNSYD